MAKLGKETHSKPLFEPLSGISYVMRMNGEVMI